MMALAFRNFYESHFAIVFDDFRRIRFVIVLCGRELQEGNHHDQKQSHGFQRPTKTECRGFECRVLIELEAKLDCNVVCL